VNQSDPTPLHPRDPNHAYHQFAAKSHDLASKHHVIADRYFNSGDYQMAAHHAHIAHGYTLHALHHSEEASRRYADLYGPAGETEKTGKDSR
jgi:hypothetical protein